MAGTPGQDRHRHLAVVRRRPRKTKSEPTARLSQAVIVGFARNRSLKADANHARMRHQIVPIVTNVNPSVTKARILLLVAGSMNCGRNARKNSATFGFSTLVKTPCWKATTLVSCLKLDGKLNFLRRSRNILIPRKIRKAPHSNLFAQKTT